MNTRFQLSVFLLVLYFPVLGQHEPGIDQVYATFSKAYATCDVSLISEIYSEEALYLQPNGEAGVQEGREAFIGGFEQMFAWAKESKIQLAISFRFVRREVWDDHAYDIGYYRLVQSNAQGEVGEPAVGKFITLLEKQADGSWRFILDGYSNAPLSAFDSISPEKHK